MSFEDFTKRVSSLFIKNTTAQYHLEANGDISEGEDGWFTRIGDRYTITRKVCGLFFVQTLDEVYNELDGQVDEIIESAEMLRR